MNNKLYSEIEKAIKHNMGYAFEEAAPNDIDDCSKSLYQLIEDVSCKFTEWQDNLSTSQMYDIPSSEPPYPTYKECFKYFINNIYKTNSNE